MWVIVADVHVENNLPVRKFYRELDEGRGTTFECFRFATLEATIFHTLEAAQGVFNHLEALQQNANEHTPPHELHVASGVWRMHPRAKLVFSIQRLLTETAQLGTFKNVEIRPLTKDL